MKKQLSFLSPFRGLGLLACTILFSMQAMAQDTIRLTWQGSTSEKTIEVKATAGTGNITVNWGDGTTPTPYNGAGLDTDVSLSHTYANAKNYNVLITTANANTALTYLACYTNQLTALDVSSCTALTYLACGSNRLTALDVSRNTALTYLYCHTNQLTALDVSNNTALTTLHCSSTQLSALDVSNNTALIELNCERNQLTVLDLSNNTALETLRCYENQLTALDVNNNTALTFLDCSSNQLPALDVSKNTALTYLDCFTNQLPALDVSNNTALTSLYCYDNQLAALDVSNNTALTNLRCYENQLTTLDISNNTALKILRCYSNQLTTLDVSNNTALTELYCYENQLTALDVSKNMALTFLDCGSNPLTTLDVSKNTALTGLRCYNNQLPALDLSKNTVLTSLYCYGNQLTALDLSQNTKLYSLECYRNQLPLSQLYPIWKNKGIKYRKDLSPQDIYDTVLINNTIDLSAEMAFGNPVAQTRCTVSMESGGVGNNYTFENDMLTFTAVGDYKVVMWNDSVRSGTSATGDVLTVTYHYHARKIGTSAALANLTVNEGELQPAFSPTTMEYTLNTTLCENSKITVTGVSNDYASVVNLSEYVLKAKDTIITISVTSEDSLSTQEYKINISLNPAYSRSISREIDEGDTFNFYGRKLSDEGRYRHTLQSIHGCDSVIVLNLTVIPKVSIPEVAEAEFTVYPNPTTGQLTVDNGQSTIGKLEVFDILGKRLSTINCRLSVAEVDLSGFANGVYILRINDEKVVKVIKE